MRRAAATIASGIRVRLMLFVTLLLVAFVGGGLVMRTASEPDNRPLSSRASVAALVAIAVAMLIYFARWGSTS